MYVFNYEKILEDVPNIEDIFSYQYLEFYKRHLLVNDYKDELNNYYNNKHMSVNSIIFKFLNIEFSNFIKEKSEPSLEINYFNWRNNRNENNEEKAKLYSDNFYFKILDFIIIKIINCLEICENNDDSVCNICLDNKNISIKCNKCNLIYHKDCLIKYILNNFTYYDKDNILYYVINYEISCPQCRKYFLINFELNNNKISNKSNYKIL